MINIEYLNNALTKITDKLNSKCLNYVADVKIYAAFNYSGKSIQEVVRSVFGNEAVAGGSSTVDEHIFIDELVSGLSYVGDDGSHANRKYVGSEEHSNDLKNLKNKLKPLLSGCTRVTQFSLKEGHPFYPVFWDFAFLFEDGIDAYIAIGSSSD